MVSWEKTELKRFCMLIFLDISNVQQVYAQNFLWSEIFIALKTFSKEDDTKAFWPLMNMMSYS